MALLNFANKYSEVSDKLKLTASDNGDFIKVYYTGDGHIITHGVDYIPWGNGTIPINKLPIGNINQISDQYLWNSQTINQKINDSFVANSAMRFKGTIGLVSGSTTKFTINGEEATFPSSSAQVGDTYRVVNKGTYAGQLCEVGDLLICITAGTADVAATWTVAQTNINGYITHKVNNVAYTVYSNDTTPFTIFAPTTGGTVGQLLVSNGTDKTPEWKNPASITVGTASTANKVKGVLSVKGAGLQMSASYNGSTNVTISLLAATTTSLGGVKIDDGGTGKKPSISVDADGRIYITAQNIKNILGYDPIGINSWRNVKVNGTEILSTSTTTDALDLASGAGVDVHYDAENKRVVFNANTSYTSKGQNYKVQVDADTSGLYVNVPWTNTTYGVVSKNANGLAPQVINTNKTSIGQSFYLLASSDGQATPSWYKLPSNAFVNTWRTIQVNGESIGNNVLNLINGTNVTITNTNGTVAINSTWRTIKIGGTSIGNKTLNFMPTGDIYVKTGDQNTETDEFDVGFGLAWYNVSTGKYEYE